MKIKLNVPTDLSEIKLHQYQTYMKMVESSNDEMFIAQKTIQIFCGVNLKDVATISFKDVEDLMVHFKKLFEAKPKLKTIINFKGIEHGFIPNLEEISLGELIDSDNIGKVEDIHKAMGVFYRPIKTKSKGKYIIEEYEANIETMEQMKDLPLDIVFGAMLFFWTLSNDLIKAIPNYLEEEATSLVGSTNSGNDGDGIIQSINSLKEMLPSLMKLQDSQLINV